MNTDKKIKSKKRQKQQQELGPESSSCVAGQRNRTIFGRSLELLSKNLVRLVQERRDHSVGKDLLGHGE